ncbi:protein PAXX isoform X3 [Heterocephalus glaber]|uniref:Protein PAXX isoform X3 n=1 Tax=Heterocephalus glaber TaxID=10181 RepID=A0AAX6T4X0_HETGA|nr:protein PAXX isoform X3 [Heterocephalus glaber]
MVPPPPPLCTLPPGPGSPRFVCYCEPEGSAAGDRGVFRLQSACQQRAVALSLREDSAALTLSGPPSTLTFDLSKVPGPEAAPRLQALTLGLAERVCSLEQRLAAVEETAASPSKSPQPAGPPLFLPDPDPQRGGPGAGVRRRSPGESLINPGFKRYLPTCPCPLGALPLLSHPTAPPLFPAARNQLVVWTLMSPEGRARRRGVCACGTLPPRPHPTVRRAPCPSRPSNKQMWWRLWPGDSQLWWGPGAGPGCDQAPGLPAPGYPSSSACAAGWELRGPARQGQDTGAGTPLDPCCPATLLEACSPERGPGAPTWPSSAGSDSHPAWPYRAPRPAWPDWFGSPIQCPRSRGLASALLCWAPWPLRGLRGRLGPPHPGAPGLIPDVFST